MIRLLYLVSLMAVGCAGFFLAHIALAQQIVQDVGTPSCEPFDDAQGNHCYNLNCKPDPDSYSNYQTCDGKDISTTLGGVSDCEPSNVTIVNHISCSVADRRISVDWIDASGAQKNRTTGMKCPHSCERCAHDPDAYGNCPRGYYKNRTTGCCIL